VAVCPATCVALSEICRAPICGTALGAFEVVREEAAVGCVGERLLSEDESIAPVREPLLPRVRFSAILARLTRSDRCTKLTLSPLAFIAPLI
jgi:hypothetical protein